MFLGELSCWVLLLIKRCYYSRQKKKGIEIPLSPGTQAASQAKQRTNINPLWMAIPACCDICGTTLMNLALVMTPASVYQMMRGMIVPIAAIMSIVFLGKKQYRHHWLGIFLIVSGVVSVGVVSVLSQNQKGNADNSETTSTTESGSIVTGLILLLLSQCFTGILFISEEVILSNYYLDPFQVVGTEGMWGLGIYMFLLALF